MNLRSDGHAVLMKRRPENEILLSALWRCSRETLACEGVKA